MVDSELWWPRLRHECNHRLSSPSVMEGEKNWPQDCLVVWQQGIESRLSCSTRCALHDEVDRTYRQDDQLNEAYDYLEKRKLRRLKFLMRSSGLWRSCKNQKPRKKRTQSSLILQQWRNSTTKSWWTGYLRHRSLVLRNWSSSMRSIGIWCSKHLVMMVSWSRERRSKFR